VAREVTKVYRGGHTANDAVSLHVDEGEIYGLLGPNGAGKTTFVRQIVGLARPTSGSITIDGVDIVAAPAVARTRCSFQPQTAVGVVGLTPRQVIQFAGRLRGMTRADASARTSHLIDALQIGEWADNKLGVASGGVARLVMFAMAAASPGRLLILDEPTNDVDPLRRRLLWDEIRNVSALGSSVLLVTHNVVEAERAVDRLAIVDNGKVVAEGTPAELKGPTDLLRVEITARGALDPALLSQGIRIERQAGTRLNGWVSPTDIATDIRRLDRLRRDGIIDEFSVGPPTLEDVYLRLTGDGPKGGETR
jgi:ABC-2 type transport system ATP-binding protein